jgi:prevent-host-death family protein
VPAYLWIAVSANCTNTVAIASYNEVMAVATLSPRTTVGVRDLKNQLSSYLARVQAGEEITVTEHGRPIALLTAVGGDIDRMAALVEGGVVQAGTNQRRRLPSKRVKLGGGASQIAEMVAEQRK